MNDTGALRDIARILNAVDAAAADARRLEGVLDVLTGASTPVFTGAGVLLKTVFGNRPFVLVTARGWQQTAARGWMRWPLRRLFTRMKPVRITDPMGSGSLALAIPFQYGAERYVVIAGLDDRAIFGEHDAFFAILEKCTVPKAIAADFSDDLPATTSNPRIFGLGFCADLLDRVRRPLERRGWLLHSLCNFQEAWPALEDSRPDIIAVDTCKLADPTVAMTTVHRAASSAALQVLAFTDVPLTALQTASVVDRSLPHHAGDREIFRDFKQLASAASRLRRLYVDESDEARQQSVARALSPAELADFAAAAAAQSMSGWATAVLQVEYGALYRSERLAGNRRGVAENVSILSAAPKGFLSEGPTFAARIDDGFIAEVTDRPADEFALRALEPRSGASIPLDLGESRRGVLVAVSQRRYADDTDFDELNRLAGVVERRYRELAAWHKAIPEFRHERLWQRLRDRGFGLDVYRSWGCETPWHYRMTGDWSGLLTLGLENDDAIAAELCAGDPLDARSIGRALTSRRPVRCFVAAIDLSANSLRYAARGFSPPFVLDGRGPVGTVAAVGEVSAGVAALGASSGAIICDDGLWRWLGSRDATIGAFARTLEREMPPGFASIVRLGSPQN